MKLVNIQALRGIAALLVVFFHATVMVQQRNIGVVGDAGWAATGVDIFFCISGFVMIVSTRRHWGDRTAWRDFAEKRLIRIVPLYWIATTLKLLLILAVPAVSLHSSLWPWHTVASYLFIPALNPETGMIWPIVTQGWTLSFELLFYILFGIGICVSRRPGVLISILLVIVSALGLVKSDGLPAITVLINPVMMEFAFGMWVGLATINRRLLPTRVALAVLPISFAMIVCGHYIPYSLPYFIISGVPAAFLLYSAISLEGFFHGSIDKLLIMLGDGSYAIYLFHSFLLPAVGIAWLRSGLTGTGWAYVAILVALVISSAAGIAIHIYIERPFMQFLKNRVLRNPARGAVQSVQ